jgi:hypothetical protein
MRRSNSPQQSTLAGEDRPALARRFVAIVQHTIIEVERDVFPLAR